MCAIALYSSAHLAPMGQLNSVGSEAVSVVRPWIRPVRRDDKEPLSFYPEIGLCVMIDKGKQARRSGSLNRLDGIQGV